MTPLKESLKNIVETLDDIGEAIGAQPVPAPDDKNLLLKSRKLTLLRCVETTEEIQKFICKDE
jgi:hypothetical protein